MQDIKIRQNTTFRLKGEVVDENGAPVSDLSSWSIKSHIRTDTDKPLVVELNVLKTESGFILNLRPEQTAKLDSGLYLYDVLIKTPTGDVYVAQEGTAEVVPTITELPL